MLSCPRPSPYVAVAYDDPAILARVELPPIDKDVELSRDITMIPARAATRRTT